MEQKQDGNKEKKHFEVKSFNEFDDDFGVDENDVIEEENNNLDVADEEDVEEIETDTENYESEDTINDVTEDTTSDIVEDISDVDIEKMSENSPVDLISRLQTVQNAVKPEPTPKPKVRKKKQPNDTEFHKYFVNNVKSSEEQKYIELAKYASVLSKVKIRKKDWATNKFVFVEHGMIDWDLTGDDGDIEQRLQELMDLAVRKWGKGEYMFTFSTPSMVGKNAKKISIQVQIGETPASPDEDKTEEKKENIDNDVLKTISALQENTNKTIMALMEKMEQQKKEDAEKMQKQLQKSEERFLRLLEENKKSVTATETNALSAIVQLMNAQLQQAQQSNKETMNMFMQFLQKTNNNKSDTLEDTIKVIEAIKVLNPQPQVSQQGDESSSALRMLQILKELDNFRRGQPLSFEESEEEEEEIETPQEPENPLKAILGLVGTKIGEGVGKAIVGQTPSLTPSAQPTQTQFQTQVQSQPQTVQTQQPEKVIDGEAEVVNDQTETQNYLADIISAIIQAKESGVSNEEIANSYKEMYNKVESQYGAFIKSNSPETIVEMGAKIDSRLNGKYKKDFIDIFRKLMR